ncbi:hypothetical protein [Cellvibrio sp. NN19]|uniref:hypothetical protein n=1 Tax=Cellvibrio chitinivorans TaxID=3102792 RepID=UPI002B4161CA|nr:hypothetical protein [Cellvibrio sp. NN19]
MWNPIRTVMRSSSPRGVKVIALSLMLVFACAAPIMLYSLFGPADGNPILLSWLFAIGAVLAHLGFLIGILLIIWDLYFAKK